MIRFVKLTDVPAILDIYRPFVEQTAVSFEYEVPSAEAFTRRILDMTAQFPWLVWEEQGKVLGYAYGSPPFERAAFRWCAEASIYLAPEARGRGIGRALYAALEQLLMLQGYRKVYSLITTANEPSIRFHQAVGYGHTCLMPGCGFKLGQWHGVVWMEKELNAVEMPIEFPKPIGEIVESDEILRGILDNLPISQRAKM